MVGPDGAVVNSSLCTPRDPAFPPPSNPELLHAMREKMHRRQRNPCTVAANTVWVRRYVRLHGVRHPATLGAAEVRAFLRWPVDER